MSDLPRLDDRDRAVIDRLQEGLPLCERPFAAVGDELGLTEAEVIERVERLRAAGVLSRFGPMFNAEAMGGGLTLAAMAVPEADFQRIAAIVNDFPEVAHNYRREHALNMWFVVAADSPARIAAVLDGIRERTGLPVHNMPKLREFHLDLRLPA